MKFEAKMLESRGQMMSAARFDYVSRMTSINKMLEATQKRITASVEKAQKGIQAAYNRGVVAMAQQTIASFTRELNAAVNDFIAHLRFW